MYNRFTKTITLTVLRRQGGQDTESKMFKQALAHLRTNNVTVCDWNMLTTRVRSWLMLIPEDLSPFDDASRIY